MKADYKNSLPEKIDIEMVLEKTARMEFVWKNSISHRETLSVVAFEQGLLLHTQDDQLRIAIDRFGHWTVLRDELRFFQSKANFEEFRKAYTDIFRAMSI